mmetsp:Transcript_13982/g.16087  ORF Transcript_13982/g.16087 Transcript_13982/m.16087 type:complete len:96 (-) Transcript_13982:81-368(-)
MHIEIIYANFGLQPFNLIPKATNFFLKMVIFFEFRVDESGFHFKKSLWHFLDKNTNFLIYKVLCCYQPPQTRINVEIQRLQRNIMKDYRLVLFSS